MASPPCRAIQRWSVASFVAAFVDLVLAALLLSAAALAFAASKVLSFFALRLPCTCNHGGPCIQRGLLADYPVGKISGVRAAGRRHFSSGYGNPYCSAHSECCYYCSDLDVGGGRYGDSRVLGRGGMTEFGGKAGSCGSGSSEEDDGGYEKLRLVGPQTDSSGGMHGKGKGVASRRRRKKSIPSRMNGAVDEVHESLPDSSRPLQLRWRGGGGEEQAVGSPLERKASLAEPAISGSGGYFSGNDDQFVEEVGYAPRPNYVNDIKISSFGYKADSGAEVNEPVVLIRNLKEALEEEQSSRNALVLELEKERTAAATAADEAMGMIFKLQEQKARLEMEARQYQRLVEEKSAYDEEEMEILKEIIIRRDVEKHFLDNQVNNYEEADSVQQPFYGNLDDGMEMTAGNAFESSSDSESALNEISGPTSTVASEKGAAEALGNSESLGMEVNPYLLQNQSSDYRKESHLLHKSSSDFIYEGSVTKTGKDTIGGCLNSIQTSTGSRINKHDPNSSWIDTDTAVLDVHVIDNQMNLSGDRSKKQLQLPPKGNTSRTSCASSLTNEISADMEREISRSCSDMIGYMKPMDTSVQNSSRSDLKTSMPGIGSERSRLENEVELLRERLMVIQQGRDKLKLSVEQKEKEKYHLNLLENISSQLQEISKAAGYGKISGHSSSASSPAVNLKKRRC